MKQRFITLDAVKVFAAISIVWLHTVSSPQLGFTSVLGRFAVPFFTSTAVFIIFTKVIQKPTVSFTDYTISRFNRIYIPFLIWSILYLLIRYLNCWITNLCTSINIKLEFLWTGTTHHLWFLPFILVVSLVTFLLAKFAYKHPKSKSWLAIIALITGIVVLIKPNYNLINQLGYTVSLSYQALPAALWGITVAVVDNLFNLREKKDFKVLPLSCIVIAIVLTILMLLQGRNFLW
ncbi:MAG: acyltransferase [Moorea sp. SIO3B2]|nr:MULTISPECIES: acyltransferase [unclassified Moorena]NEP31268.1 acyltransferase [Moorena sp. SIO3B2]NES42617.1 acyltransferase [Moorena sp. SIO2C4]